MRIQNKISSSRSALPLTVAFTIGVLVLAGLIECQLWVQLVCLTLSTYLMVELNNVNALIRVYSRMVSCSFLVLTAVASFLFADMQAAIVQLCLVSFYITLFRSYQLKRAPGWIFYAFFCIGLASIVFVQILFYVPVFWLLMATNLMSMSWRAFWASLLGLLAPYWFSLIWFFYQETPRQLADHFASLATFSPLFDYSQVNEHQLFTFVFVTLLALIGTVHYLRQAYQDKIRTRMIYHIFITVSLLTIVFIVLQPLLYNALLPILIVNTAPLTAHFISLTNTRLTNWTFVAICVLSLALIAYNLWSPSFIF